MKYCTLIFVALSMLLGCNRPIKKNINKISKAAQSNTTQKNNTIYNTQLLKEYSTFLFNFDTTQLESSTIAAKKFVALFKGQDVNTCDSAYFIFYNYYCRLNNNLDNLHNRDTIIKYDSLLTDSNNHRAKLSPKLESYAKRLKDNGFKVYTSEGDTYIGEDLDFIAKWFYSYLSKPLRVYLMEDNSEDKEGFSEDAGLTISPYQLAERTVWWERFATENPNTIVTDKAKSTWKGYLATLLEGMDNSPVVETGSSSLSNYYKIAYTYIQTKYSTSQTNKIVVPYYKLLLKKQNERANTLLKDYKTKKIISG